MKPKSTNNQRHGIKSLARELGYAPNTIRKFLRMSGAPKPDDQKQYRKAEVEKWLAFQKSGGPELANIKAEHRAADLGFARLQLKKARASAVTAEDVDASCHGITVEMDTRLRAAFETPAFLKRLEGRTVAEIRRAIEETYDRFVAGLKNGEDPPYLKATTSAGGKSVDPKIEIAAIAAEIRTIELKIAERQLIPMGEVDQALSPGILQFSAMAEAEFESRLPGRLRGLPASEMLPLIREARFRCMQVQAAACKPIMTPAAFAALEVALGPIPGEGLPPVDREGGS